MNAAVFNSAIGIMTIVRYFLIRVQIKSHVTRMADTAFRPELLVNLTAALGIVAKACGLPPGWVAKPSFRITPQGASLQVVWSATPAARVQCERKEVKKRRSRSSRQRSADRAAAHKARSKPQMSTSHQQALNPASKSFTPNPAPPPPIPSRLWRVKG